MATLYLTCDCGASVTVETHERDDGPGGFVDAVTHAAPPCDRYREFEESLAPSDADSD